MSLTIRRLGPGDEVVLDLLAREDASFDIAGRGEPRERLSSTAARAYLADPAVLHWVAQSGGTLAGFMYCHVLRKRAGAPVEVLLYEIGVRSGYRRQKIGTALVAALDEWMAANGVRESWVLADNPGAVDFYRACGFRVTDPAPVYLTRGDEDGC